MKITNEEVVHVANLARIDIDTHALEEFAVQIGKILEYVDILNRVDTTHIRPTSHATHLTNVFRNDENVEHTKRDAALANAPEKEDGAFVVPKIIG